MKMKKKVADMKRNYTLAILFVVLHSCVGHGYECKSSIKELETVSNCSLFSAHCEKPSPNTLGPDDIWENWCNFVKKNVSEHTNSTCLEAVEDFYKDTPIFETFADSTFEKCVEEVEKSCSGYGNEVCAAKSICIASTVGGDGQHVHNCKNVSEEMCGTIEEESLSGCVEEEEEEEEPWLMQNFKTSMLGVAAVLIIITIIFDVMRERLEEKFNHTDNQKILNHIFAEMTVLGFLGFVTYVLQTTAESNLMEWSHVLFGEGTALTELLESMHMDLFMAMLVFAVMVVLVIWLTDDICSQWKRWEMDANNENELIKQLVHEKLHAGKHGIWRYFHWSRIYFTWQLEHKLLYLSIRHGFVQPFGKTTRMFKNKASRVNTSVVAKLKKHNEAELAERLENNHTKLRNLIGFMDTIKNDFDFALYLNKVMKGSRVRLIIMDTKAWVFLFLQLVVFWAMYMTTQPYVKEDFDKTDLLSNRALFLVEIGGFLYLWVFILTLIYFHLHNAGWKLAPRHLHHIVTLEHEHFRYHTKDYNLSFFSPPKRTNAQKDVERLTKEDSQPRSSATNTLAAVYEDEEDVELLIPPSPMNGNGNGSSHTKYNVAEISRRTTLPNQQRSFSVIDSAERPMMRSQSDVPTSTSINGDSSAVARRSSSPQSNDQNLPIGKRETNLLLKHLSSLDGTKRDNHPLDGVHPNRRSVEYERWWLGVHTLSESAKSFYSVESVGDKIKKYTIPANRSNDKHPDVPEYHNHKAVIQPKSKLVRWMFGLEGLTETMDKHANLFVLGINTKYFIRFMLRHSLLLMSVYFVIVIGLLRDLFLRVHEFANYPIWLVVVETIALILPVFLILNLVRAILRHWTVVFHIELFKDKEIVVETVQAQRAHHTIRAFHAILKLKNSFLSLRWQGEHGPKDDVAKSRKPRPQFNPGSRQYTSNAVARTSFKALNSIVDDAPGRAPSNVDAEHDVEVGLFCCCEKQFIPSTNDSDRERFREYCKKRFQQIDVDGSNLLDHAEFETFLKDLQLQRQAPTSILEKAVDELTVEDRNAGWAGPISVNALTKKIDDFKTLSQTQHLDFSESARKSFAQTKLYRDRLLELIPLKHKHDRLLCDASIRPGNQSPSEPIVDGEPNASDLLTESQMKQSYFVNMNGNPEDDIMHMIRKQTAAAWKERSENDHERELRENENTEIVDWIMAQVDSDNSGTIDLDEFIEAVTIASDEVAHNHKEHEDSADANKLMSVVERMWITVNQDEYDPDATITAQDLYQTLKPYHEDFSFDDAQSLMMNYDDDGDGRLNLEEFRELVEKCWGGELED